jgi:hypothetical protein
MQASASREAAEIQARSQAESLAEQRRQFDIATQTLRPYAEGQEFLRASATPFGSAGNAAAMELADLLGVGGTPDPVTGLPGYDRAATESRQKFALDRLQQSPAFQEKIRQGEEALLSRASATGGLRGGNIQAALAQFRPALLAEEIDKRVAQLGGLAGAASEQSLQSLQLAGAAAARQAASGLQFGQNIGQTLGNIGAAQAQGALSGGRAVAGQFISSLPQLLGQYQGGGGSLFGGSGFSPADQAYLAGRTTTQYSPF